MKNSLKGISYLSSHPEARAEDLKEAFADDSIKMVLCAIGGNDTVRTLPYLLNDLQFLKNVNNSTKIFMGFSDTTVNHLMLYKLGLNTIYGPAFLTDFAELADDMLPYTKNAINFLFNPSDNYEIKSSDFWYKDRTDFSEAAVGTDRERFEENKGYELLLGKGRARGELLGGCLDVIAKLIGVIDEDTERNLEQEKIIKKYDIFPTLDEWKGKIMFIETSEEKMSPNYFKKIIQRLKTLGVFDQINGLIVGKPIDEVFYNEYKQILISELGNYNFPALCNINFGHATPRTLILYGALTEVDADNKKIKIIKSTIK